MSAVAVPVSGLRSRLSQVVNELRVDGVPVVELVNIKSNWAWLKCSDGRVRRVNYYEYIARPIEGLISL